MVFITGATLGTGRPQKMVVPYKGDNMAILYIVLCRGGPSFPVRLLR
jgi:hypothetical protein